jgi:hypothetical protein
MTSQLQVLDMVVNNHSKGQLHNLYDERLSHGNCQAATARNIRPPEALLGHWIKTTWNDTSPESIKRELKECTVSNNVNGPDDDVLS